jgi:glycosyltransferase involved in cell wall biosynthesis
MASSQPVASIGVPVYNTERYIAGALDSLLAQTFPDFELIISDNASTDGTREICESYARRDRRIRYIRQKENIGLPRNWNAVVHAASGEFFKWASASDYCAPNMIERCIAELRADNRAVLCYGKTQMMDEAGKLLDVYAGDMSFDECSPSERFWRVSQNLSLNNAQCGVMRLAALRQTRLDREYPAGDMVLMAELALYGRFKMLPDVLLFRRQSPATLTSMLSPIDLQRVFNPQAKAPLKLLRTRWHMDNLFSIGRSPIPLIEKLRAGRAALRGMRWERGKIARELLSLILRK